MNNTILENIVDEYINSKISIKNLAKKHGVGKDKLTKILKFPTEDIVPRDLIRHFMRGYFEGDGG